MQGAERDDLIQEGMIGLYKAVRAYKQNSTCTFRSFADICVTRHLISVIRRYARQRYAILYSDQSCDNDQTIETDVSDGSDPAEILIASDTKHQYINALRQCLSSYEWQVYIELAKGKSYQEIAKQISCDAKSVDNARSRIRRKALSLQVKLPLQ